MSGTPRRPAPTQKPATRRAATVAPRERLLLFLARAWQALRVLSGDAAYETYLEYAGGAPLSREAFYLDTLRRRYGRPNRCC